MSRQKMPAILFIFLFAGFLSELAEAAVLAAVGTAASSIVAYLIKRIMERKEKKQKPPGKG